MTGDDSARAAISYLRALPGDPPLDLAVQRLAIAAACRGEHLREVAVFEEADPGGSRAFLDMVESLRTGAPGVEVIAATAAVFGDRVRDRARRILQLAALHVPVRLADGRAPGDALVLAWEERGADERRRERAREGMRRRALRGEVLGRAPFGYVVSERQLVPDPGEAATVRHIFAMYLDEDEGIRKIAKRLNEEGLRTRTGRPWTAGAVRTVLRNAAYTGLYRRLGVTVTRAHPALVTAGQHAEVLRRMASRRTAPATQERRDYLLSGLVRCGYCGGPMIGARRPGEGAEPVEHSYYRCQAATNEGRCAYHTRRTDALERAVVAELARANAPMPIAARPRQETGHAARRTALDRTLDLMLERRAAGQWTDADLVRRAAPVVLEQLSMETEAATERADPVQPEQARARLVEEWDRLGFEERRSLLHHAVAEVVVTDDAVRVARRR
ncbi:MAG: recombinase family protein [Dehalococcoidia bacterium]